MRGTRSFPYFLHLILFSSSSFLPLHLPLLSLSAFDLKRSTRHKFSSQKRTNLSSFPHCLRREICSRLRSRFSESTLPFSSSFLICYSFACLFISFSITSHFQIGIVRDAWHRFVSKYFNLGGEGTTESYHRSPIKQSPQKRTSSSRAGPKGGKEGGNSSASRKLEFF